VAIGMCELIDCLTWEVVVLCVLHVTWHQQLKTLTVVLKCRPFVFVGKKCDVAVSTVSLFVIFI
jgi:hypothetical protein